MKTLINLIIVVVLGYALFIYSPQIRPLLNQVPQAIARLNVPLKFWPKVQEIGESEDTQVLGTDNISETISQTQQDLLKAGQEKYEEAKTSFINSLVDKFYEALINKLETEREKTSTD